MLQQVRHQRDPSWRWYVRKANQTVVSSLLHEDELPEIRIDGDEDSLLLECQTEERQISRIRTESC